MLIAVSYGLMLPAIAVMHPRHAAVRPAGAILGSIAGTAAVTVGLAGAVNLDLQPAALFVLGIWWWTIGRMWVETGVLPRAFGLLTAAGGVVALFATILASFGAVASVALPGADLRAWDAAQVVLGLWLLALGLPLWAGSRPYVPMRDLP
ncbi:MAG TPA: hypothetical protein VMJ92_00585 [Candidatus Limnocylindrales bacterium]|nr:hypothetical protein [Candidatus Limnocylindrales bacterium]